MRARMEEEQRRLEEVRDVEEVARMRHEQVKKSMTRRCGCFRVQAVGMVEQWAFVTQMKVNVRTCLYWMLLPLCIWPLGLGHVTVED